MRMIGRRLLVALGLGLFIVATMAPGPPDGAGPPPGTPGLAQAIAVADEHATALLDLQGVAGVGVGLTDAGTPTLVVFTESEGVAVPSSVGGLPTTVVVTGKFYAQTNCFATNQTTVKCDRPVPIGVTTGHPAITAGTIGARVVKASGATPRPVYALSNNHIYADENRASIGDSALQPGPYDGGVAADSIGTLADYEPIQFCAGTPSVCPLNVMDAAIALSSTANLSKQTVSKGYGAPGLTVASPQVNLAVTKCGRTTGCTKGKIYAINATVNVGYDSGVARFTNQIVVVSGGFSAGGDSGSLVVTPRTRSGGGRQPVGLLFAGGVNATIINPISPILSRFGVTVDGN